MSKRLLQINECLHFSTGKITQQIGEAAIADGWGRYIAYSGREPYMPSMSKIIRVGNPLNSYIHYAENLILDREGLSSRIAIRKLIKQIKDIKLDIVHLHNIHISYMTAYADFSNHSIYIS